MGKYFVNEVKCSVSNGGMACGPVEGTVNVSVNVTEGDKTYWVTNSEFTGIPSFYVTQEDIFDKIGDIDDEEFAEYLNNKYINEYEGISLGEYDEIFDSIKNNSGNPAVSLIRYIILLTRCPMDSVEEIVNLAKGKYIDEVEIPKSDIEKDLG